LNYSGYCDPQLIVSEPLKATCLWNYLRRETVISGPWKPSLGIRNTGSGYV